MSDEPRTTTDAPVVGGTPEKLLHGTQDALNGYRTLLPSEKMERGTALAVAMNLLEQWAALVPRPEPRACCSCGHSREQHLLVNHCSSCLVPTCRCTMFDARPEPREPEPPMIDFTLVDAMLEHLEHSPTWAAINIPRGGRFIRFTREDVARNRKALQDAAVRPASAPSSHYPIRAHVEGCPKALRVPVDLCECGGCDVTSDPSASAPSLDYVQVLKAAKAVVNNSVLYKKFIDGTPLENDIAVWMADFVFAQLKTE